LIGEAGRLQSRSVAASYISLSYREACLVFTLKINGTPHEVDFDGDTPLL
jgi:hypothetical protein